ncbi:molecular chaperone HtpG [Spirochaeta lutea]|uniref:Chaperone protein HtpG n=1 Tax=Spirochaeta lutea TaxID=1480694 RepID=A0A098QVU7_9SPIO|nr:molecular chaperone HtpG [Spirochaeta lutea]KGE71975.1 molecular chaperone Hsp90 [Spirochaeta lutea]
MAKHSFQTEVGQLLQLITHSLYSHKEIFIRELVSNSSDALDKLKYLTLTDDQFKELSFEPRIDISFTDDGITIQDNGIGMNEADLTEHLGTIAKSGTKAFLGQLTGDTKKDSNLIGQFGVGFYSAFMVADTIDVFSRRAGEDQAYQWSSDGKGEFETAPVSSEQAGFEGQGTRIILHINEEGKEYANRWQIEQVVKKYSNHIAFPIFLHYDEKQYDDKGKEKGTEAKVSQINSANALWKRPKSELAESDYHEFYKTIGHDTEDPLFYLHTQAEGTLEYTTLFYVPKKAPFDLFHADYKPGVKLYVKRVFITDDDKELLPSYLRFVRGVIDSEDLPLNVSREILQQNRVMVNIRNASVKKLLGEFTRIALEDKETYKSFIDEFNRPLKEGLYSDYANKEQLLELVRFKSTKEEGWVSLEEYKSRMLPDQKAIYYITGEKEHVLRNSPLLEAYKKKDIEVLIMDDEIDEIVVPGIGTYKEVELKAVNRSDAGEDLKEKKDKKKEKETQPVVEKIKKALGDRIKDVRVSVRLADSPSCIVMDESDPSFQMQAMLKAMGQNAGLGEVKPILEVNPDHAIVQSLKSVEDEQRIADLSFLLFEQAMLIEGAELKDPAEFVKRLNRVLERSIS